MAEQTTKQPLKPKLPRGGMTLEECGQVLGLTRERIRQIEASALKKLRQWCFCHGIDVDDLPD